MRKSSPELSIRPLESAFRVDFQKSCYIHGDKEQIADFIGYGLGIPLIAVEFVFQFVDLFGKFLEAFADVRPIEAHAGGAGRYLKGFEKSEPLTANTIYHYQIGFPANDHTFKKGHRIMVQVQSTWFPVIDRNPQKFVANIFQAKESDFQPATQRVFRSGQNASYIELPIESK